MSNVLHLYIIPLIKVLFLINSSHPWYLTHPSSRDWSLTVYIYIKWLPFKTVLCVWNFSTVLQNVCFDELNIFNLCKIVYDKVSEWSIMSTHRLLFQWASLYYKISTKFAGLVQNRYPHQFMEMYICICLVNTTTLIPYPDSRVDRYLFLFLNAVCMWSQTCLITYD
jgi:hypothetical protein